MTNPVYVLGDSGSELDRLARQARYYEDLTLEVLRLAGIRDGMRVLDVGSGGGDVSMLVRSLVGPGGEVIGVDRSAESVKSAGERARASGFTNVRFVQSELSALKLDTRVDAVVGRFVLLYLADPAAVLRHLASFVVPGGIVAFQEMDMHGARAEPPVPLFDDLRRWIVGTFKGGGVEPDMAGKLCSTFTRAGLAPPEQILRAKIEGRPDGLAYGYLVDTLRSLLPMTEKLGIATAAEVQVDTLAARLRDQVVAAGGTVILPLLVGAWSRVAG